MDCAEDYVKFCIKYVLKNNKDDLDFFNKLIEKGIIDRLNAVANSNFKRLPYTEAIEILEKEIQRKDKGAPKFEEKVYWGCDLASEHEKWLTDQVFKGPVIVYNYPRDIKSFYMKLN